MSALPAQRDLHGRWFPICSSEDLPAGHVFEAELLGQELAVWRGRAGSVNVWENRCPHRGLRLTIGANLGTELRCAYHGYRFADGSGLCTAVPALPTLGVPRSLCVRVFPVRERGGLYWTRLTDDDPSEPPIADEATSIALYSVAVGAPAPEVQRLLAAYRFRPSALLASPSDDRERCSTSPVDAFTFRSVAYTDEVTSEVRLFLQPVDGECTRIHGILLGDVSDELRLPALEHHAARFNELRSAAEAAAARTMAQRGGSTP